MRIVRIEPNVTWSEFVVVRLLRRWVAARRSRASALPSLVQLADDLGEPAEAAVALHSLFQLTEDCLGRELVAECCCGREMSADERATRSLVAAAPARAPFNARDDIPHGLPGALCWAAASARIALDLPQRPTRASSPARCPFDRKAPRQAGPSPNFLRQTESSRS